MTGKFPLAVHGPRQFPLSTFFVVVFWKDQKTKLGRKGELSCPKLWWEKMDCSAIVKSYTELLVWLLNNQNLHKDLLKTNHHIVFQTITPYFCYSTSLCRIQVTQKASTNIDLKGRFYRFSSILLPLTQKRSRESDETLDIKILWSVEALYVASFPVGLAPQGGGAGREGEGEGT